MDEIKIIDEKALLEILKIINNAGDKGTTLKEIVPQCRHFPPKVIGNSLGVLRKIQSVLFIDNTYKITGKGKMEVRNCRLAEESERLLKMAKAAKQE